MVISVVKFENRFEEQSIVECIKMNYGKKVVRVCNHGASLRFRPWLRGVVEV